MVCLLARLGLRFRVPDFFFVARLRAVCEVSFGPIPKMPIMGLVESLLGISSPNKQPAATYRARILRLPIGMADIVGVCCCRHDLLRVDCDAVFEFSIDNRNSLRGV